MTQSNSPSEGMDDVRARALAIIEELNLLREDLDPLFLAANLTADMHQSQQYRAWLRGAPASPMIDPRRFLTLLEQRRQRRVSGREF